MAAGDLVLFEEFARELGEAIHDFSSHTFKVGLITSAVAPTAADATPRWGDYSGNEVADGASYDVGGPALANLAWTEVDGVATLDADDVEIDQDDTGFTDARYLIIYDDSDGSDRAVAFGDLGEDKSIQSAPIVLRWNTDGILQHTVNPA